MNETSEHVDAVVVGSGFGGAVSAYRLAEAGTSVVVLERGRPYPPGTFARSPREMGRAFWDPSAGLHGLFDIWKFGGFDSVISSGLGGGSLIYANVLLRKDEKWFVHEEALPGGGYETWPVSRADLDPHYDAVETMLSPERYPIDLEPFADTPKAHAMAAAATARGWDWQRPPLAVRFAATHGGEPGVGLPIEPEPYGNIHGVPRRTCRLTGECDVGCNDGAKNTLDHTYLSAAAHHGADVRTLCEVRGLRPRSGGGYEVSYVTHRVGEPAPTTALPVRRITCDRLVLGAGTYGTTRLLLLNRASLPGTSPALGTRFSGNGDLLTFLMPKRGERARRRLDGSHGPVITSAIRIGDGADGDGTSGRGFYIQDGGYPGFVDWMVESANMRGAVTRAMQYLTGALLARVRRGHDTSLSAELSRLVGSGSMSAGALPLLGMGRDVPDGVMALRGDRLDIDWNTKTSLEYFGRVRDTMCALAEEIGTDYVDNPLWFFKKVVSVHPLGGAPMGHSPADGVVDPWGQVYGHPGLYVADGAAMPGPVGANPSLTIAAHADRMCTHILEETGRTAVPAPRVSVTATPVETAGAPS